MQVGEESNGREISLRVGQVFTLALPENPSTGYAWKFVTADNVERNGAPICSKISDVFVPPAGAASSRAGSPGVHQWRFRAEATGTAFIEMRLTRGWDLDSAKRSFSLRLFVT